MAKMAALPVHFIVVSNQAGIALARYGVDEMRQFNTELRRRIEGRGGRIDAVYYCPDLEPKHLKPDQPPSDCSKPAPGMLLEAARDFHLHLSDCIIVGDKRSDVMAGHSAGTRTILIGPGKLDEDLDESPQPTWNVTSFSGAVEIILSIYL